MTHTAGYEHGAALQHPMIPTLPDAELQKDSCLSPTDPNPLPPWRTDLPGPAHLLSPLGLHMLIQIGPLQHGAYDGQALAGLQLGGEGQQAWVCYTLLIIQGQHHQHLGPMVGGQQSAQNTGLAGLPATLDPEPAGLRPGLSSRVMLTSSSWCGEGRAPHAEGRNGQRSARGPGCHHPTPSQPWG